MMAAERLAVLRPSLPSAKEILPFLEVIDGHGQYTNHGPLVCRLESELAGMFAGNAEAKVVAMASGTAGLELTLAALQLAPGSRVLLPSLTFPATAGAVLRCGCVPVFGDVDLETWQLCVPDPSDSTGLEGIDAVVPVAAFGMGCDTDAWGDFAAASGLPVVVDAAGAFGNQQPGTRLHCVFSLHATKALGCGEGGFLVTSDPAIESRVRIATNFGFDQGWIHVPGTNGKLSEYHAAVALAALRAWPDQVEQRRQLAGAYQRAFARMNGHVIAPSLAQPSPGSVFPVRLPGCNAGDVADALGSDGIESRRWYWPPLHQHPAFAGCGRIDTLENTELLAHELIGLPFHLHLPDGAPERVARALSRILTTA